MSTAIAIRPNGEVSKLSLPDSEVNQLATLYREIGCTTVDVVRLTSRIDMWVDDEGLFSQPLNRKATLLARRYGYVHQGYHGTAILCGLTPEGATVGFAADQAQALLSTLGGLTQR